MLNPGTHPVRAWQRADALGDLAQQGPLAKRSGPF